MLPNSGEKNPNFIKISNCLLFPGNALIISTNESKRGENGEWIKMNEKETWINAYIIKNI